MVDKSGQQASVHNALASNTHLLIAGLGTLVQTTPLLACCTEVDTSWQANMTGSGVDTAWRSGYINWVVTPRQLA
jgi:hypothetical protein